MNTQPRDADSSAEQPAGLARVRLADLTGASAVPRSNGELVFDAPWHARAFGMAIGLCRQGEFDWPDFQRALSDRISRVHQSGIDEYYECWLVALTQVMSSRFEGAEVERREEQFRSNTRDEIF